MTELNQLKGVRHVEVTDSESIRFNYRSKRGWSSLAGFRLVNAIYFVQPFEVPRPKSLMGHANWQIILAHIERVREEMSNEKFRSIYLQAAGQDSAVFQRFLAQLKIDTGLKLAAESGDLLVRVRRHKGSGLWELVVRLTTRPLVTRPWRVANMPGALNGPLAAAMVRLSGRDSDQTVLNVMCGSGSILAECGLGWPEAQLYGCDLNPEALVASQKNLAAAKVFAELQLADGRTLPYRSGQFSLVLADLPWGQLIGTREENRDLYPRVLAEISRVLHLGGHCVLMTQEARLIDKLLHKNRSWAVLEQVALHRGNIHPQIYLLERSQ